MRPERIIQASIFDRFAAHEIGRQLEGDVGLAGRASGARRPGSTRDLRRSGVRETGRRGPASGVGTALRAAQAASPAQLPLGGFPSYRGLGLQSRALAGLQLKWNPANGVWDGE